MFIKVIVADKNKLDNIRLLEQYFNCV